VRVKDELDIFLKKVRLIKSNVYAMHLRILNSQQQSLNPTIKVLPTQQEMNSWTTLRADVDDAREELLKALIKKYPLLEEKSLIKIILLKIKFYFKNPFFS
jgi:hypothetical protein